MTTVLKEGWMVKEGSFIHNWKSRWFVLYPQSMAYFTEQNGKKKGSFLLPGGTLVNYDPTAKQQPTFAVRIPGAKRIYRICAADHESRDNWMNAIKKVIDDQGETSEIFVPPPDNDVRRPARKLQPNLAITLFDIVQTMPMVEVIDEKIDHQNEAQESAPRSVLQTPFRRAPGRRPPSRTNKAMPSNSDEQQKQYSNSDFQSIAGIMPERHRKDSIPASIMSLPIGDQPTKTATQMSNLLPPTETEEYHRQEESQYQSTQAFLSANPKISKNIRGPQIGPIGVDSLQSVKLRKATPKQEDNPSKLTATSTATKEDSSNPFGVVLKKKVTTQETKTDGTTNAENTKPSSQDDAPNPFGVVLKKKIQNDSQRRSSDVSDVTLGKDLLSQRKTNDTKQTCSPPKSTALPENDAPNPFGVVLKKANNDTFRRSSDVSEVTVGQDLITHRNPNDPPKSTTLPEDEATNPFGILLKRRTSEISQRRVSDVTGTFINKDLFAQLKPQYQDTRQTTTEEPKSKSSFSPPTITTISENGAPNPFGVVLKKKTLTSDTKPNDQEPKQQKVDAKADVEKTKAAANEETNIFGVKLKKSPNPDNARTNSTETNSSTHSPPKSVALDSKIQGETKTNPFGVKLKPKTEQTQNQSSSKGKSDASPIEHNVDETTKAQEQNEPKVDNANITKPIEPAKTAQKTNEKPSPESNEPISPFGVRLKKSVVEKPTPTPAAQKNDAPNPFGVKLKKANVE